MQGPAAGFDARATANSSQALLITELFPPTVGGSAVLLSNIYRRLRGINVTVLTDPVPGEIDIASSFSQIDRYPMRYDTWGISNRRSALLYIGLARSIASIARGRETIGYC